MWIKTYGNLFKKLAFNKTGEILIGLKRIIESNNDESNDNVRIFIYVFEL
jgi:hypothetical protein